MNSSMNLRNLLLSVDQASVFAENFFPCPPRLMSEYTSRIERGLSRMRKARTVICGLARGIAPHLPYTMARMDRLASMFLEARILLYENDSDDSTLEMLEDWSKRDPRVQIVSERLGRPRWDSIRSLDRVAHMSDYRNRYLDEVRSRYSSFDNLIVFDTDLPHGFSYDGIAHTFSHDDWDLVGSNGVQLRLRTGEPDSLAQYDAWAFRDVQHPEPHSCEEINPRSYERGEDLVPVWSCFGGLAVYRLASLPETVRYGGGDCEHVVLHRQMRELGFDRIFLNPNQIVIYPPLDLRRGQENG